MSFLGKGTNSEVFKAFDILNLKEVACKILNFKKEFDFKLDIANKLC